MDAGIVLLALDAPVWPPLSTLVIGVPLAGLALGTLRWRNRSDETRRRILWGILLLPIVLYLPLNIVLWLVGLVRDPRLQDFGAYYNAAVRFVNGYPIYRPTAEIPGLRAQFSGGMPYLYPPIFVLLFVPFTVFPPEIAGVLWDLSTLAFLVWSASRLVATFDVDLGRRARFLLYLCIVSFAPTVTWTKAGQVSGLLAGLLCLSGVTLRRGRHELSGAFTALGSAVKPFYATSGAHLLRSRRRLIGSVLTGIALLVASVVVFGLDTHLQYLDVLRQGKGWRSDPPGPDAWNAGKFSPFFVLGPLKHLPRLIIVLGTAGVALYSNRTETPVEYVFALGVAIIPLAGPTTNTLALNAVVPAVLMVGLYELETTGNVPKIPAVSVLLVHVHPYTIEFLSKFGPRAYPPIELLTPLVPLLQPALYGTVLLVGYLLYRSWNGPAV